MELRHLEHFVAVSEEQHFTRAAERLHIAQSGLSASVRALERELGADLFTRTTRRVQLTAAGRAFLVEARRTLAGAAAAREAVAAVRGLFTGTLAVGTEQCMGIVDPVSLLADLRGRHPGVEVHMVQSGSAHLLEEVRGGTLDLAFVVYEGHEEGVRIRPLATEPMMLLCRPDHPLVFSGEPLATYGGEPLSAQALAGEVFVDLHRDWGARRAADALFAAAGTRRTVAMEVNDVYTLLDLVARGMGVAVVPRPVTHKDQARGLAAVPLDADTVWNVGIAVPRSGRLSPAAQALLESPAIIEHQR
ncbi:LysR family transcriptional regulator [Streptomyces sp. Ru73]|uniref:LysR family transcriptional regulator n=1 Tax=Streptomyces sp. Ru73 TaxID=2080748 RepID=UPI000CDD6204|nr:LysR family transcriptional regulator [Streptomyces sp. Ru73]POX36764.1 LysR family transcriptional regulator [Streptomyces sp. Ru73]